MKNYELKLNERQLRLINHALEMYFRTQMGQFFDYADELAFTNFDWKNHDDADFDIRCSKKWAGQKEFEKAYAFTSPNGYLMQKSPDVQLAIDIWQTIRYNLWREKPEPKSHDTVESDPPLNLSGEPLVQVEGK